jgi:hypothetical protein
MTLGADESRSVSGSGKTTDPGDAVDPYLSWNDAIAARFFRPEEAGQPVWLFLTESTVEEIGTELGGDLPAFIAAVKTGPGWARTGGLCQRALHAYEGWRDRGLKFPPYVAYLGLFVMAAGLEGAYARHAYYPRLRALLKMEGEGALSSFDRMLELWGDLETWSVRDAGGKLGIFEARIVGGQIHIGLPIAQTILSEDERRFLPRVFSDAGLDPTSLPPADEVARLLRQNMARLRPRTRELIRSRHDPESYSVLLDTVLEALADWDGTYQEETAAASPIPSTQTHGTLRLCLAVDRVAGRLSIALRCRLKREFPAANVRLSGRGMPPLECSDSGLPGWSTPLIDAATGGEFDATTVAWDEGVSLRADQVGWRLALPPRRVRIFEAGQAEGLPGLVEVGHLPRAQPFYLLFRELDWPHLADWAARECSDFRELGIREGLAEGWRLAQCAGATGDRLVRATFPELALPDRVRLALVGGIRIDSGSTYFPFALPSVLLDGGDGRERLICNGERLEHSGSGAGYSLPDRLPLESRIVLEAVRDGEKLRSRSLYLAGRFEWRRSTPHHVLDPIGRAQPPDQVGVAGGHWNGQRPDTGGFSLDPLSARCGRRASRTIFVGRVPGQVYESASGTAPTAWPAVWAIPLAKRSRAVYCGRDVDDARPVADQSWADRRSARRWREALWYRRKRTRAPEHPALVALWRSYIEVARDV